MAQAGVIVRADEGNVCGITQLGAEIDSVFDCVQGGLGAINCDKNFHGMSFRMLPFG
jgi:hypothetical protein